MWNLNLPIASNVNIYRPVIIFHDISMSDNCVNATRFC